jgi:transketolase
MLYRGAGKKPVARSDMNDTTVSSSPATRANTLRLLAAYGQSCWIDDLSRRMLRTGELADLVEKGVSGVTANPATFGKAITESDEYDREIERGAASGRSVEQIYDELVTADIRDACDILRPVYDATNALDGYVSLEVSPHLAHDAEGSIAEGRRLSAIVDRPNLFIKIPGTLAGLAAIEQLLYEGINVNITLLFSVARYEAVAQAYKQALERRTAGGKPINAIASVASFFLSRIDVLVDERLGQLIDRAGGAKQDPDRQTLLGRAAVANAKLAYQSCKRIFTHTRWRNFSARGARLQRLLWASTSTKNPAYPELMYVEPLIGSRHGPRTVTTMPPKTLAAFLDHGAVAETIEDGVDEARRIMAALERLGIDFDRVASQLEDEGIEKFIEPYDATMRHLAVKRERVAAKRA